MCTQGVKTVHCSATSWTAMTLAVHTDRNLRFARDQIIQIERSKKTPFGNWSIGLLCSYSHTFTLHSSPISMNWTWLSRMIQSTIHPRRVHGYLTQISVTTSTLGSPRGIGSIRQTGVMPADVASLQVAFSSLDSVPPVNGDTSGECSLSDV